MAPAFLTQRIERMSSLFRGAGIDRPLLKAYPIDLSVIVPAAKRVMARSLGMDNITPNGAVTERDSVRLHYRALRVAVVAEMQECAKSKGWSTPILRVAQEARPGRPYATDKWHSDIWRGEPRFSMNVILPLWGTEYSVVEFREPSNDTFYPLNDYAEGNIDGTDYAVPFEPGFIYYFDSMCLHRTMRKSSGERASVDLRLLFTDISEAEQSPWHWASTYEPIESVA